MTRSPLSRRTLLRGAGAAIALPLLDAMQPARAAEAPVRRVVFFFMPHGTVRDQYVPTSDATGMKLSYVLSPLEPFKRRLTVIRNMHNLAGRASPQSPSPHHAGSGALLTGRVTVDGGWGTGISIDRHMGAKLKEKVPALRFPSLVFGVQSARAAPGGAGDVRRSLSYDGSKRRVTPVDSPAEMLRLVFGAGIPRPGGTAPVDRTVEKDRAVLDFVAEDARRLRAKLGGADRARLDEHLAGIEAVTSRLAPPASTRVGAACKQPEPATAGNFAQDAQNHLRLCAMALGCDLTRVALLQFAAGQSELNLNFIPNVPGHAHHWLSHHMQGGPDQLRHIQRWHVQQLASFCDLLNKMPEGNGTVLDNTAVVLLSEIAEGPSHSFNDAPFLVVGGLGGALKTGTGQILDAGGRGQNDLFVSLMHGLGLPDTSFGAPAFNRGPLPGLAA